MADIAAGDIVFLAAAVLGPPASFVIHEEAPELGVVESVGAGSPPTDVVVVWQDGRRTQYDAVGSGATSLLYRVGSLAPDTILIIGFVAQPKTGSGIPNPGSRLQGPVVQQYGLEDPTGSAVGEVVVIDTPLGFLAIATTDAAVLPSA